MRTNHQHRQIPLVSPSRSVTTQKGLRRLLATAIGLIAATTVLPSIASAFSDGSLDTSFGTGGNIGIGGTLETDIGSVTNDDARSLAIQTDGKIVVAGTTSTGGGDYAVVRYSTNGTLDTSFDIDGKVTTDIGTNSSDEGYSVAIQSDGKLVVAGSTATATTNSQDFAVVRYKTDGSLDTSFDTDGRVTTDVGSSKNDAATSVAIQSDGKIVVAGFANTTGTNSDYAVVRYNTDGSLDTTFDTDGMTMVNVGDIDDTTSLALQSDGKLVIAGSTKTGIGGGDIAVARLMTDGSLDTSFNTDGKVTTDVGTDSDDYGRSVVIQSDGKIVVVGQTDSNSGDIAVVRYNTDGSLDSGFDTDGKVTTNISQRESTYSFDSAFAVTTQSNGKLVVVGQTAIANFVIVRYNTDGSLDSSFGIGGKVNSSIYEGNYDIARSVAIQSDEKIVVAGYTDGERSGNIGNFGVARYGTAVVATTTTSVAATTTTVASNGSTSKPSGAPKDKTVQSLAIKDIVAEESAVAGSSVSVEADGFTPSESVTVGVMGSTATTKSVTANPAGKVKANVTLPSTAKGEVTLYAYGRTSKHGYRDTVTVTHPGTLPTTGSGPFTALLMVLGLLAAGFLISGRRGPAKRFTRVSGW